MDRTWTFCGPRPACPAGHKKLIYLTYRARGAMCPLYIVSRLREVPLFCGTISREQSSKINPLRPRPRQGESPGPGRV